VRRRWFLLALLAAFAGALVFVVLRKGGAKTIGEGWPANFAHRGASLLFPENTALAFREAVASGAGGLELDVHMTRDGTIVVMHDETVDRTTSGSGAVRAMALADLQALDAGCRFVLDGGYPYRGRGVCAPALEEVFREFPDAAVNIEIKAALPGVEEAVLRVIREARAEDRTLVASGRHGVIRRFRELSAGRIATSASRREIKVFYLLSRLRLEGLLNLPYDALQVPVTFAGKDIITPRFVEAAHARGVRVDAWTVDDPREMRRLLDLGVDVIMTNRPDVLSRVLEEREGI
jgi:glycerophosphoryl diester phosphodiesterase